MKPLSLLPEADDETPPVETAKSDTRQRIAAKFAPIMSEELRLGQLVSYAGNKNIPLLRLYRYKEAFSFGFVQEFIKRFQLTESDYLFDPFSGMGTTLFTAMQYKIPAISIDRLPLATFISQTLPLFFKVEPQVLLKTFAALRTEVTKAEPAEVADDVPIMKLAFPADTLLTLRRWKGAIDTLSYPLRDIFLLLFLSILEPCSYTAKERQFLRLKSDKHIAAPNEMLESKVYEAENDILSLRGLWALQNPPVQGTREQTRFPSVQLADARDLSSVNFEKPPTALITSLPCANRYDYTRTYSLELCFNFVRNYEDLKALRVAVLPFLHTTEKIPHPVIEEIVNILRQRGKALHNPHLAEILTAYFVDMRQVISNWARVLAPNAKVAMVVNNVRFEGEMVPVDLMLSEMAEEFGFKVEQVIVVRYKTNSSQQISKYGRDRVRESILIWQKK